VVVLPTERGDDDVVQVIKAGIGLEL